MEKGRDVGTMTLKEEDISQMYIEQSGRCYCTDVTLEHTGDWLVSLERLNPSLTCSKENCCLILARLHSFDNRASFMGDGDATGANWSREKFLFFCETYSAHIATKSAT